MAPLKLPSPIQELKGTGWEVVGDIAVNLHSKGMVAVWVAGLSRYKQGDNHATGAELTGEQRNSRVTSLLHFPEVRNVENKQGNESSCVSHQNCRVMKHMRYGESTMGTS
jgi:hypothetical protein